MANSDRSGSSARRLGAFVLGWCVAPLLGYLALNLIVGVLAFEFLGGWAGAVLAIAGVLGVTALLLLALAHTWQNAPEPRASEEPEMETDEARDSPQDALLRVALRVVSIWSTIRVLMNAAERGGRRE